MVTPSFYPGVYWRWTASAITPCAAAFGGGGQSWDFESSELRYEIQLVSRQVLYGPRVRVRVIVKVRIIVYTAEFRKRSEISSNVVK